MGTSVEPQIQENRVHNRSQRTHIGNWSCFQMHPELAHGNSVMPNQRQQQRQRQPGSAVSGQQGIESAAGSNLQMKTRTGTVKQQYRTESKIKSGESRLNYRNQMQEKRAQAQHQLNTRQHRQYSLNRLFSTNTGCGHAFVSAHMNMHTSACNVGLPSHNSMCRAMRS